MRNYVLSLVIALAMQETKAKRDDTSRYVTMLESLLEKQKGGENVTDQPAEKKMIQPRDHTDFDEPSHPEVKREGRPADHQPVSGEHREAPGKLGSDPSSYNYRELVQKDLHQGHRMAHPPNDELVNYPLGYGMDPHQPHD